MHVADLFKFSPCLNSHSHRTFSLTDHLTRSRSSETETDPSNSPIVPYNVPPTRRRRRFLQQFIRPSPTHPAEPRPLGPAPLSSSSCTASDGAPSGRELKTSANWSWRANGPPPSSSCSSDRRANFPPRRHRSPNPVKAGPSNWGFCCSSCPSYFSQSDTPSFRPDPTS